MSVRVEGFDVCQVQIGSRQNRHQHGPSNSG